MTHYDIANDESGYASEIAQISSYEGGVFKSNAVNNCHSKENSIHISASQQETMCDIACLTRVCANNKTIHTLLKPSVPSNFELARFETTTNFENKTTSLDNNTGLLHNSSAQTPSACRKLFKSRSLHLPCSDPAKIVTSSITEVSQDCSHSPDLALVRPVLSSSLKSSSSDYFSNISLSIHSTNGTQCEKLLSSSGCYTTTESQNTSSNSFFIDVSCKGIPTLSLSSKLLDRIPASGDMDSVKCNVINIVPPISKEELVTLTKLKNSESASIQDDVLDKSLCDNSCTVTEGVMSLKAEKSSCNNDGESNLSLFISSPNLEVSKLISKSLSSSAPVLSPSELSLDSLPTVPTRLTSTPFPAVDNTLLSLKHVSDFDLESSHKKCFIFDSSTLSTRKFVSTPNLSPLKCMHVDSGYCECLTCDTTASDDRVNICVTDKTKVLQSAFQGNTFLLPNPDNLVNYSKSESQLSSTDIISDMQVDEAKRVLVLCTSNSQCYLDKSNSKCSDEPSRPITLISGNEKLKKNSAIPKIKSMSSNQNQASHEVWPLLSNIYCPSVIAKPSPIKPPLPNILTLLLQRASFILPIVFQNLSAADLLAVSHVNKSLRKQVLGTKILRQKVTAFRQSQTLAVDLVGKENLGNQSKKFHQNNFCSRKVLGQINYNPVSTRAEAPICYEVLLKREPIVPLQDQPQPRNSQQCNDVLARQTNKSSSLSWTSPCKILETIQAAVSTIQAVISPTKNKQKTSSISAMHLHGKNFTTLASTSCVNATVTPENAGCCQTCSPLGLHNTDHGKTRATEKVKAGLQKQVHGKHWVAEDTRGCYDLMQASSNKMIGADLDNRSKSKHVITIHESPSKYSPIKLNLFARDTKRRLRRL